MKKQTLKLVLILFLGLFFNNIKAQTMYVRPISGTQSPYPVANIQKLTFSGGNLIVTNTSGGNGTFALSGNRYINFNDLTLGNSSHDLAKNKFYLYPNPSSTILNVSNDDVSETISQLEIISPEGRVLIEQSAAQVEIDSLPAGMYFCRITSNNKTQTIKFLKQ